MIADRIMIMVNRRHDCYRYDGLIVIGMMAFRHDGSMVLWLMCKMANSCDSEMLRGFGNR